MLVGDWFMEIGPVKNRLNELAVSGPASFPASWLSSL
jgi:hypothetical protein